MVKRFRLPASNQEAVLSTFEEEGWPPSIDDPLPFMSKQRCKERLHATIRHLNANHQNRLIRFRGNGTGEAVLWEPIAAPAADCPTVTLSFAAQPDCRAARLPGRSFFALPQRRTPRLMLREGRAFPRILAKVYQSITSQFMDEDGEAGFNDLSLKGLQFVYGKNCEKT